VWTMQLSVNLCNLTGIYHSNHFIIRPVG